MQTLIEPSQIRGFYTPTGNFSVTGFSISGNIGLSGNVTGISGSFSSFTVGNLFITGSVVSPFLSGILGTQTSGSGIIIFSAMPDASGGNLHFRHVESTGLTTNPIQEFSSNDSQDGWAYFNAGNWNSFPALGLSSALQSNSIIKHVWVPTGFSSSSLYFSHLQNIYAGLITGSFVSSVEYHAQANGFDIFHLQSLQSFFETADNRYVRKQVIGTDSVISGSFASGIPLVVQTFPSIPSTNRGTGTIIDVSGRLFCFHVSPGFTGYVPVGLISGITTPTGGIISGLNGTLVISGQGNTVVSIVGNNIIAISGSGGGGSSSTSIGGVTGFGVADMMLFTGAFIATGVGSVITSLSNLGGNISGIVISGGPAPIDDFSFDQIKILIYNQIGY